MDIYDDCNAISDAAGAQFMSNCTKQTLICSENTSLYYTLFFN